MKSIKSRSRLVTGRSQSSEKAWHPAQPSLPLIASVHKRMQPPGEPCRCKWCRQHRGTA